MSGKLFQFAIIKHPSEKEAEAGISSVVVVDVVTVLANDQNSAVLLAGRAIPEDAMEFLDRLEVVVRPF